MPNSYERRAEILAALNVRRRDTIENLAFEFKVCRRTMINDIQELSISNPLYTVAGRHGGGVYMMEGRYAGRKYFTAEQTELLTRISSTLNETDKTAVQAILKIFAVPEKRRRD